MTNFRKKKGFVLALTLFVILAISSFSVAMMGIIQKNSQNSIRSHQINTVNQAAEFGLESGRLWLTDQMSRVLQKLDLKVILEDILMSFMSKELEIIPH